MWWPQQSSPDPHDKLLWGGERIEESSGEQVGGVLNYDILARNIVPCALDDDFLDVNKELGIILSHDGCKVEELDLQRVVLLRERVLDVHRSPNASVEHLHNLLIDETALVIQGRGMNEEHG